MAQVPSPRYFPPRAGPLPAPGQVLEWLKRNAWNAFRRFTPSRGFESLPVRCGTRSRLSGVGSVNPPPGALPVLIRRPPDIRTAEITDESLYLSRREWLASVGLAAVAITPGHVAALGRR